MKFLFFILLFPSILFSQNSVNPNVNAFIDSLDSKINYFFVEKTHPGLIVGIKKEYIKYECIKADYYLSTDLYWEDLNLKSWKKSFYSCSDDNSIETNSEYLNFAEKHFETIRNEEVLKYQTKKDSVVGDIIYGGYKIKNHQATKNYVFRINSEMNSKNFEDFYLTTEGDNINFDHNQNLRLIELHNLILNQKSE